MKVVEETLVRVYSSSASDNNNNNNNPPPPPPSPQLNSMETILTAAIDDNIHVDCVYFLLRRHPDILLKILSTTSSSSSEAGVVMGATATAIPNIATATTVGTGINNNQNGTKNDNDNDKIKIAKTKEGGEACCTSIIVETKYEFVILVVTRRRRIC